MIAPANRISSLLVDASGKPLSAPVRKPAAAPRQGRDIQARYDAAQTTNEFQNYWAAADALDADSSHSKGVRQTLVKRSRYEVGNNGFADGMVQTHANFLVGLGPKLRMQSSNPGFNQVVERAWTRWAKAVQLRRKLWCMAHAKVQDGEAFGVVRNNPNLRDRIKLDLALFETEQCQSPHLPYQVSGYVDGIRFDEFGNPLWYDVLRYHPGGAFGFVTTTEAEQIPAKYVAHWFTLRRPGQHRAVPEFRSTLNTGASSRRWREATVTAAESAADISLLLETENPGNEDAALPDTYSTVNLPKRSIVAAPAGYKGRQVTAEHPNAQYSEFHKAQINEQARPKSMPFNVAACDSSSYNYASGRLDHQTWYGALDVEREDGNDLVLDVIFPLWWERAVDIFGWQGDPSVPPDHGWDWPKHPVADVESEANAIDTRLKNGSISPRQVYSDAGQDFDDAVGDMARDYGVDEKTMRQTLLRANFQGAFINAGAGNQQTQEPTSNA